MLLELLVIAGSMARLSSRPASRPVSRVSPDSRTISATSEGPTSESSARRSPPGRARAARLILTPEELPEVQLLQQQAADDLTRRHGFGHWSKVKTLRTLGQQAREKQFFVVVERRVIVATFT